jgi:midasin (ATPase involved in ribosome maturation)
VTAAADFRFVGTMNPGGDYGKKELSPALKNRFTEIWCPAVESAEQIRAIAQQNLVLDREEDKQGISQHIVQFIEWIRSVKNLVVLEKNGKLYSCKEVWMYIYYIRTRAELRVD